MHLKSKQSKNGRKLRKYEIWHRIQNYSHENSKVQNVTALLFDRYKKKGKIKCDLWKGLMVLLNARFFF